MKGRHLGVQTAIVLTMVAFVSWPQFRPIRAQSVWRYAPAAAQQARTDDAARYSDPEAIRNSSAGVGQTARTTYASSTQAQIDADKRADDLKAALSSFTPLPVAALGGRTNALVGLARTSLNGAIPYAMVLLRNILTGQVRARATANDRGQFSFVDLDSNLYVVELLGPDGSVVATSPMVGLVRGEVRQIEVRVAAGMRTVAVAFGDTLIGTLPQTTKVAANNDVMRTTPMLVAQESTR
jgi:hypothetical protein